MNCFYCNQEKEISSFERPTGSKPRCKGCYNRYHRQYLKKNPDKARKHAQQASKSGQRRRDIRKAFLTWLKQQPCHDCQQLFHSRVMEFDHVCGAKVMDVGKMVLRVWSEDAIWSEIQKCELVCANCHRTRTAKRELGEARFAQETQWMHPV